MTLLELSVCCDKVNIKPRVVVIVLCVPCRTVKGDQLQSIAGTDPQMLIRKDRMDSRLAKVSSWHFFNRDNKMMTKTTRWEKVSRMFCSTDQRQQFAESPHCHAQRLELERDVKALVAEIKTM